MNMNKKTCTECKEPKDNNKFERYQVGSALRYKDVCEACETKEFYEALKMMRAA